MNERMPRRDDNAIFAEMMGPVTDATSTFEDDASTSVIVRSLSERGYSEDDILAMLGFGEDE